MASKAMVVQPDQLGVSEQEHTASLSVQCYHFNVLQIMQCAAQKFEETTGRPARFFYAPEPFLYLVDQSVREQAERYGNPVPEGGMVRNVFGMELVIAPGTCFTITADDIVRDATQRRYLQKFQPSGVPN